jgi:putative ATPase
MICAGEDPRFIARRMIIFASEDIGLADSRALLVADAAARAVEYVGLPECRLNLAHAVLYLALAPKSNSSIRAISAAAKDVEQGETPPVPPHLRDSHYPSANVLGHGKGYLYPHNYPGNYVKQAYLPDGLEGREYYRPGRTGEEENIIENWMRQVEYSEGGEEGEG